MSILWEFETLYFNHIHSCPPTPPRAQPHSIPTQLCILTWRGKQNKQTATSFPSPIRARYVLLGVWRSTRACSIFQGPHPLRRPIISFLAAINVPIVPQVWGWLPKASLDRWGTLRKGMKWKVNHSADFYLTVKFNSLRPAKNSLGPVKNSW